MKATPVTMTLISNLRCSLLQCSGVFWYQGTALGSRKASWLAVAQCKHGVGWLVVPHQCTDHVLGDMGALGCCVAGLCSRPPVR